jgi:hypothetical protein
MQHQRDAPRRSNLADAARAVDPFIPHVNRSPRRRPAYRVEMPRDQRESFPRIVGRIEPPQVRCGDLREIEFGLRKLVA